MQLSRGLSCGRNSQCVSHRRIALLRPRVAGPLRVAAVAEPSTAEHQRPQQAEGVKAAKHALLEAISTTGRGVRVSTFQRAALEELQVSVENFGGPALDFELLPGKWRLIFTTAADVLPILEAEFRLATAFGPSPVQVGNIFQRFTAPEEGVVENIIELGLPFLEGKDGITLTVGASYEVRSPHRIALTFEEARVGKVRISPTLEALLAPALLPRGWLQQQLLLAIKTFQLTIPFRSAEQLTKAVAGVVAGSGLGGVVDSPQRMSAAYQLSFLDADMLIGRATSLGGTFIFQRHPEEGEPQATAAAAAAPARAM